MKDGNARRRPQKGSTKNNNKSDFLTFVRKEGGAAGEREDLGERRRLRPRLHSEGSERERERSSPVLSPPAHEHDGSFGS